MEQIITEIHDLIEKSNKITILTGAGISTESGIADFRSPGGVWSQYKTVTIQEFEAEHEKRVYYWKYKHDTIPSMLRAKPNNAHKALGTLDKQGKIFWLLTQNIDGLHEMGGVSSERIINLHGTNRQAICLSCGSIYPIEEVLERIDNGDDVPVCHKCNGYLKPNTVSFGQNLNMQHLRISEIASSECDLFMALGSSLVVQPAANFVDVAHRYGHPVIIINRDSTPYDSISTISFSGSLADILPQVV